MPKSAFRKAARRSSLIVGLLIAGTWPARAQETWAPVATLDGVNTVIGGITTPLINGPVPPASPIYSTWDLPNPAILFPNGFAENPIANEWIVADTYHGRLLRFATDHHPTLATGAFIGVIPTSLAGEASAPYGPVVDDDGTIVLADYESQTIKIFVDEGSGYSGHAIDAYVDEASDTTTPFLRPYRVVLLPDASGVRSVRTGTGAVLVLDSDANTVVRLRPTGVLSSTAWPADLAFGSSALLCGCAGPGIFNFPTGLAVDAAGNIYVSDPNNTTVVTIQVFDPSGNPLQVISQGLSSPWALAIAPDQRLFVTDTGNNRIAVFSPLDPADPAASLQPLPARIGSASQPLGGLNLPDGPNPAGPPGEVQEPTSIGVDQFGRLLVADTDNGRVTVFDRAHLTVRALAVPQTVSETDTTVDVRVSVWLPSGEAGATGVLPAIPVVSFSQAGGGGTGVIDPVPSCIVTPSSVSAVDCQPLSPLSLVPGQVLSYTFRFDRIPGTVGPAWFSVNASGLDLAGVPISSDTARTYAVAVDGTPAANPPTVTASFNPGNPPAANGWFNAQPVLVDLSAAVADANDGVVQEIEYNFGPVPPEEGDYYVCFNVFTNDPEDPSCSIPVYKSGVTTLWYRALSSRGLYDTLQPDAVDPSALVPGWTSIDVKLDISAPTLYLSIQNGRNGWSNRLPATVEVILTDTESLLDSADVTATGADPVWSFQSQQNVPAATGTVTFNQEGYGAIQVTATDRAGNVAAVDEPIGIDVTPPTVDPVAILGSPLVAASGSTWSSGPITAVFTAHDALSGFDNAGTRTTTCQRTVASGVGLSVACDLADYAGNFTTATAGPFSIDSTAPTFTATAPAGGVQAGGTTWYRTPPGGVDFVFADTGVGFASGATTAVTAPVVGPFATATVSDLVGNSATATAGPFGVDADPPVLLVTPDPPHAFVAGTPWYRGAVSVRIDADDRGGSGFPTGQQISETVVSNGQAQTRSYADLLGNAAIAAVGPFHVDNDGPVVAISYRTRDGLPIAGISRNGTIWFSEPVDAFFAATDAGAGFSSDAAQSTATQIVPIAGPGSVTTTFADLVGNQTTTTAGPFVIDSGAPTLMLPGDIVVPASVPAASPVAALVSFPVSAVDTLDPAPAVVCDWASGSSFPYGTTTVHCTAADTAGNTSVGSFTVTVEDRTRPVLTVPGAMVQAAMAPAVVEFTATAADNLDPAPVVVCTPASGSTFPLGQTLVSCTATDGSGNSDTRTFSVTLASAPPTIHVPAGIVVEAAGPAGAVVSYSATASDDIDGALAVSCVPASGSTFPLGTTTATCTATNSGGMTASAAFTVSVLDTLPPLLTQANITAVATGPAGAAVIFAVAVDDLVDGPMLPVACSRASGSVFPLGATTVNCTATDSHGNTGTVSFVVEVTRSLPVCSAATASPANLWPPNHKWVEIRVTGITNADGTPATVTILGIFQDEPVAGLGDGDTPIDGAGVGTGVARVRSERAGGGNGRVYHIRYRAVTAGGSCTGEVTVGVPKSQGHGPAIDDGPRYDSTQAPPPLAGNDATSTRVGIPVVIDVLANDADPLGRRLTIASISQPSSGSASVTSGRILYRPAPGFSGTVSFGYQVSNGAGGTATATITVEVKPHAPGDGCDHDKYRNGHYNGDNCDHDRSDHDRSHGDDRGSHGDDDGDDRDGGGSDHGDGRDGRDSGGYGHDRDRGRGETGGGGQGNSRDGGDRDGSQHDGGRGDGGGRGSRSDDGWR
ncbi:MAG: HYR domain-containing protein [Acidobacteria bacterium]|nr:HYR domain-containing protein [Acidobacteriota bacterium]